MSRPFGEHPLWHVAGCFCRLVAHPFVYVMPEGKYHPVAMALDDMDRTLRPGAKGVLARRERSKTIVHVTWEADLGYDVRLRGVGGNVVVDTDPPAFIVEPMAAAQRALELLERATREESAP